jgi:dipeptidyl aminopeptidase/acylaminoacyl peptidase
MPERKVSMIRTRPVFVIALAAFSVSVCFSLFSCATQEVELIPREVLFGNPDKARARISPNGEMLAYISPVDDVLNVWVRTIGEEDDRVITKDEDRGIVRYFWAEDSKHIMYLQDKDGNENWRLYDVSLETGDVRDLTPYEGVQVNIVSMEKDFPDELILTMNKENPQVHDVYHLDLTNGELTMVARNPGNVLAWVADEELEVRAALAANAEGGTDLLYRADEEGSWDKLVTWGPEDNLNSAPLKFSKNGNALYCLDSRNANAARLVRLSLPEGKAQVLAEDPQYDVTDVMFHHDTNQPQAVSFLRAREEWTVLDDAVKEDFEKFAKMDEGDYSVVGRDNADDTWLVAYTKDDGPVSYYAYDRDAKEGSFLFDHKPELKDYELAKMKPVFFTARDGLTIHGYITYPPGKDKTNLPMVLNVHGGPYYRDAWGYNPEAQWLANRGYVCLQVNFRGSTGYGKDFLNAGNKEWGGRMHDDLIDAVNWAKDQGIADPDRIAIYGASYGGYAALVGATFTPDVFACAVEAMGPANLVTWIQSVPPYWSAMRQIMYDRIGNPETEEELLLERSPLFKVDQIKIPMLIAQGANDVRVPMAESEQIVAALKEKGIEHQYMLFPDEGHGFLKEENRLKFYKAAEEFLAEHLGGRHQMDEES